MSLRKLVAPIGLAALLAGCTAVPTPYQPIKDNEGYADRRVGPNEYEIQVRGNGVTTHPTLVRHFQRRAAELCGSPNYDFKLSEGAYSHITEAKRSAGTYMNGIYIPGNYSPEIRSKLPYISGVVTCH